MKLQTRLFSLIIFVFSYPLKSPANDRKNSPFLTFGYVTSDTNSLLAINKSTSRQEDILSKTKLKASPVFSNMYKLSRTNNNSTADHPDFVQSDVDNFNVTFDEKAREDAFEKKPAAESPHAVMLLMYYGKNDNPGTCTGSLLTADWVLTAAHCVTPPKNRFISKLLVYAGGYNQTEVLSNKLAEGSQLRSAKAFLPHPKYTGRADYDIGLVAVTDSFELTDTVNTAEMSTQPWNHKGYRKCQLTGFGIVQIGKQSDDDKVRKTHMLDVKQPCLCSYRLKMLFGSRVVGRYICARPQLDYGPCPGDSGGGLVCDGKIRGVAMQLVPLLEMYTCETDMFPDIKCGSTNALSIFQDSCPFLRWINSHVRLFNDSQISEECVDRGATSGQLRGGGLHLLLIVLVTAIIQNNQYK